MTFRLGNWPYPEAEDIWARSTTIEEGERFEELLLSDFIEVGRRVGRRTLRRLSGAPFEEALLDRGLRGLHSVEEADLTNDQVMSYSAMIGTVMVEEMACTNREVRGSLLGRDLG